MGSIRNSIAWTLDGRLYAYKLNPDFEEVTPTGKTIYKDPAKVGVVVVRAMETPTRNCSG